MGAAVEGRRRWHGAGLLAAAVASAVVACTPGCVTTYQPTVPMRARTNDVELELREVRDGGMLGSRDFVFISRTRVPHTVEHGWLTVATRAPCSGGAEPIRITIDDLPRPALPAGEHQLTARFDRVGTDPTLDLVLDVELEEPLCVRTPVVSQALPLEIPRQPALVIASSLDGNADLSGLRAVSSLQLGGAVWAGPVLVTGLAGLGVAICNEGTCGKDGDKGKLRDSYAFPASVEARFPVGSFSRGIFASVISLGGRYSFMHTKLPTLDGGRALTTHGAQGYLSWAFGERVNLPVQHPERQPLYELTIPIGVLIDPGASLGGVVFAAGFGVRFFLRI